ncbi:MAG: thioredoxin family protein [Syntrophobacterales bacterium]|nr:thioredoxin family protein [Syntrophobacterales bacterium]
MHRRILTTAFMVVLVATLAMACSSEPDKQPPAAAAGALTTPGRPAVLEFGAKTCAPCIQMQKVFAELTASHGDQVDFRLIYADEQRHLFPRFRITLIPTQIFVDAQGREVERHIGPLTRDEMLAKLKQLNFIR